MVFEPDNVDQTEKEKLLLCKFSVWKLNGKILNKPLRNKNLFISSSITDLTTKYVCPIFGFLFCIFGGLISYYGTPHC